MPATGLEVRLHEGRERAEVTRFTRTLDEIVLSLREIDHVHLLRGTRATWVLADLKHEEDDLVVRLEARQVPSRRDWTDMLVPVAAFVDGAAQLREEAAIPPLFAPNTVRRLARIATPRDGVQSVTVSTYNGSPGPKVDISSSVQEHATTAVKAFEISYGSLAGHLAKLVERRGDRVGFTIRDETHRQAVEGSAPIALAEELRAAWMHRVRLGGKIKRNVRGQAIRIDVDQMERLPEDNRKRPRAIDLLGAAPHWAQGLTPEEWMEAHRGK